MDTATPNPDSLGGEPSLRGHRGARRRAGERPSDDSRRLSADTVTQYLGSMGEYELLTAQQEVELAQQIENAAAAFDRLEAHGYRDQAEEISGLGSVRSPQSG